MALVTRTAASSDIAAEINLCADGTDVLYLPAGSSYTCNLTSTVNRTKRLTIMPAPGAGYGDVVISNSAATTTRGAIQITSGNKLQFLNLVMADLYNNGGSQTILGGRVIISSGSDLSFVNCRITGSSIGGGQIRNVTFDRCDIGGTPALPALTDVCMFMGGANALTGSLPVRNVRFNKCVFHDTVAWDTTVDGNTGSKAGSDGDVWRFDYVDGMFIVDCEVHGALQVNVPGSGLTHSDLFSMYGGAGTTKSLANIFVSGMYAHNNECEGFIDSVGQTWNFHLTNCSFGALTENSRHIAMQNVVGMYVFNCSIGPSGSIVLGENNSPDLADNRLEEVYFANTTAASVVHGTSPSQSPLIAYFDHCAVAGSNVFSSTSTNMVTTAPTFVSAPDDLHPASGSSTIDAGVPVAFGFKMPTVDRDGNARDPVNPDIGAYEF